MAIYHQVDHTLLYLVFIQIVNLFAIEVVKKLCVWKLITLFVLLVFFRIHLVAIISQVDVLILIVKSIFVTASPQVALFISIKIKVIINESQDSDVEFSALVKEWALDVFLNNEGLPFQFAGKIR